MDERTTLTRTSSRVKLKKRVADSAMSVLTQMAEGALFVSIWLIVDGLFPSISAGFAGLALFVLAATFLIIQQSVKRDKEDINTAKGVANNESDPI